MINYPQTKGNAFPRKPSPHLSIQRPVDTVAGYNAFPTNTFSKSHLALAYQRIERKKSSPHGTVVIAGNQIGFNVGEEGKKREREKKKKEEQRKEEGKKKKEKGGKKGGTPGAHVFVLDGHLNELVSWSFRPIKRN